MRHGASRFHGPGHLHLLAAHQAFQVECALPLRMHVLREGIGQPSPSLHRHVLLEQRTQTRQALVGIHRAARDSPSHCRRQRHLDPKP